MSPHLTPQNSIQMVDTNDFAVIISLLFWFIDGTHNINQPPMINEISLKSNFWAPPNDNERMIDWLINANFDTNNFHISLSRWYFCGISWSTLNANHDRFPAFRAQYHFQLIVKFIECFFSSFVKHDEIINRNCQHCHWYEKNNDASDKRLINARWRFSSKNNKCKSPDSICLSREFSYPCTYSLRAIFGFWWHRHQHIVRCRLSNYTSHSWA